MGDLADHTVATPPSREVRTADIMLVIHSPCNTRVTGGPTLVAVEHLDYPELGNKRSLIVFSKAGILLSVIENPSSAATGLWEARRNGIEWRGKSRERSISWRVPYQRAILAYSGC